MITKNALVSHAVSCKSIFNPGVRIVSTRKECADAVKNSVKNDRCSIADFDPDHPELESVFDQDLSKVSAIRPRLLLPEMREKFRKQKRPTSLSMRQSYILGENGFYSKSDSFVHKVRWEKNNDKNSQKWEEYKSIFEKASMPEMSQISKIIADSLITSVESWNGFKRILPFEAATILAHMHGMQWHDLLYIIMPISHMPDVFVKYQTPTPAACPLEGEAAKIYLKAINQREQKVRNFEYLHMAYRPCMYPIHEFGVWPDAVSKAIDYCEKMPEMDEKPGFDYYWVLVPSVSLAHPMTCHPDGVFRIKIDGKVIESKDESDVSIAIDKFLVSDKIVAPCILGERDGKCYFIGMWMN